MVDPTEYLPFDFPVQRVHKRGTPNLLLAALLALVTCAMIASILFRNEEGPHWYVIVVTLAITDLMLFADFRTRMEFSASLNLDKTGIVSELSGDRNFWSWQDVADVKVELEMRRTMRSTAGTFFVKILRRGHGPENQDWTQIWDGGLNQWRLEATIQKGMRVWGRGDPSPKPQVVYPSRARAIAILISIPIIAVITFIALNRILALIIDTVANR